MEELPDSLDETYERILREIRKPNEGHARRMLQCLVAAIRPLRVAELAEVLAFDFGVDGIPKLNPSWRWEDHEEAVMSTCSSLVMIVGTRNDNKDKKKDPRIVQFSHFSVKEFLMSSRFAESSRDVSHYHIAPEPAHTILAQACLGILLRLDDRVDRDKIQDFPLAEYAARYWAEHARFKGVSSHILDGMECLFDADKPHFSTWLWIYNEDLYYHSSMATKYPIKPDAVPLYYAALLGLRDLTARLLTEHPEDAHTKGGSKVTPLHASVDFGHSDVFSLLVEHFPNLDIKGDSGRTPVHLASWGTHLEMGKLLLDHGADVNAGDNFDRTPLFIAAWRGQLAFVRMLLNNGAMTNIPHWKTPLHMASEHGHVEVVRLLLEHGADLHTRDESGRTPSESASLNGKLDIVQLLSQSL
jgi:hypothetical protein